MILDQSGLRRKRPLGSALTFWGPQHSQGFGWRHRCFSDQRKRGAEWKEWNLQREFKALEKLGSKVQAYQALFSVATCFHCFFFCCFAVLWMAYRRSFLEKRDPLGWAQKSSPRFIDGRSSTRLVGKVMSIHWREIVCSRFVPAYKCVYNVYMSTTYYR